MDLDDDELWFTKYKRNYVSKDKIREKIEKYKILAEKSLTRETLYIYKNIIYTLERLLDE